MAIQDLVGQRFGRLTVIKFNRRTKKTYWTCLCNCGNKTIVAGGNLKSGGIKSCGCLLVESRITHGMRKTRFYSIWTDIKKRCNNPKNKSYKYYGGQDIKVCERWEKFEYFRDDMYESYLEHIEEFEEKQTTLDRINFKENYTPENCRWATLIEQANNKRSNHFLTYKNETKTISQWAKRTGINSGLLWNRLNRGWSVEKTLTYPKMKNQHR